MLAVLGLSAALGAKTLPPVAPVTLTSAWSAVGLPDAPLQVAAHGGQLWVSGENEMLAVSTDAGHTWQVVNEHHDGEMLFALVFPAPNQIVAYGTAGVRLESRDGGKSWKRSTIQPDAGLSQVVQIGNFAVSSTVDDFGVSTDGGQHWSFRGLPDHDAVLEVAALDAQHALVLFEPQAAGQPIAVTANAGADWNVTALPGYRFQGVHTGTDGYTLYGENGKSPTPAAAHSADGFGWAAAPVPTLPDLSFASPGGVPDDPAQPISLSWAATGGTLCRVSAQLRCRLGTAVQEPAVEPAEPKLDHTVNSAAHCLRCAPPQYPSRALFNGRQGAVVLQAVIGTDGKLLQVLVRAAPSAALALAAAAAVRKWEYNPLIVNGKAMEVATEITVNFQTGH